MTTYTAYLPVDELVPWWPDQLVGGLDPGSLAIVGYELEQGGSVAVAYVDLLVLGGLTLTLPDVDGLELELPGGEIALEIDTTGPFQLRAGGFGATLRLRNALLVPVTWSAPDWEPLLDADGAPAAIAVTLDVGSLVVDEDLSPSFVVSNELTVTPFMLGATGIVVEVGGARLHLSGKETPPAGQPAGFRGIAFERVTVNLPGDFALPALAPESIVATGLVFGNGGVSGSFAGSWTPSWDGTTPLGDSAGTLLGFPFALRSLGVTLVQGAVASCGFEGELALPFLDTVVAVSLTLDADGLPSLTLAAGEGALTVETPAGTFTLDRLGMEIEDGLPVVTLGGSVQLTVASPAVQWPTIVFQELRITRDGQVRIPGGWLTLQEPLALDLYGFGMEVTRLGFGAEEDGRRWIGVDGAIRLTELLPAGASARGLRVLWDPADPAAPPSLALDGIGVTFGVPDVFAFEGAVALAGHPDDPAVKLFTGQLGLGLDALDVGVDAGITIGRDATATYVFVHVGVNVPIPIAATGAALYGLQGLFAMNMSPVVTNAGWPLGSDPPAVTRGDWYGWYKQVPGPFSVTDPFKWSADVGAWAFGAGLSIGTLPDAGFTVNTKALLVVLLPGPVLLLEGTADIFKVPAALAGESEGTLSMLAALDGRAGTLQLGIDAAWSLARVLEIAAGTEAFFDFDRLDAWHLWLGRETPASARIRADYLSLFHADAWLMLDAKGVGTGLGVSWGDSWKFGPARLTLAAWVGGSASLVVRPPQLAGGIGLGGEMGVAVGPFGLGIGVEAGLEGQSFAPYLVAGTLSVVVELPTPIKDLDVDIRLAWSQPEVPEVSDPWEGALVEHERCTESWAPAAGGDTGGEPALDAPVVPLDARVLLTFAKPMGDDAGVADNAPVAAPVVAIGDHQATYAVTALRLFRRRRSHPAEGWQDVTDTVAATWTPDAGDAGTRLQLLARSPFAFTRFTSRRWTDAFLAAHAGWPCTPALDASPVCVEWSDREPGGTMPALWTERGATFSTDAELRLVVSEAVDEVVLRLGAHEVDGEFRPGVLWVALPEPAAQVSALVNVPLGDWVVLRAWAGERLVGSDLRVLGVGVLHVAGDGIDALTLDWGLNMEAELGRLCWVSQAETDAVAAWQEGAAGLETAAGRWESEEPVLDPDSHYLLEVTTRALLTKGGAEVQRVETTHAVQFQTGGPPAIVPDWVDPAPPATTTSAGAFPHGGVLKDLASYVRWSVPDAGAVPVFRAYDLGCEFDATHVQQMYGADMQLRLRDDNGQPAVDDAGAPLVFPNAWEEAPTTTLTTSESAWLTRLDACTGAVQWTELRGDDRVTFAATGLLYDDFSGAYPTEWTAHVLDPAETRAANWHLADGVLRQDVDVAGGDHAPDSPDKPGTVYVAGDVDAADVALETVAWAEDGAYGLVLRWRGPDDYLRFSVGRQRARLVAVRAGVVHELWSSPEPYAPAAATRLLVQAEGARLRCQVDERLVCDVRDDGWDGATASGAVGLYTWNGTTAAFDEVRARPWPGPALAPARAFRAELEASRPLLTDDFESLDAFEQQELSTGDAASGSSAAGGTATIARGKLGEGTVVALAGDPDAADHVVECNARPGAEGVFGLAARHDGVGSWLALELMPGVGRALRSREGGSSGLAAVRTLWEDAGPVAVGQTYALSLRCEGDVVTVGIDGETFTVGGGGAGAGRVGLLSGIPLPDGCAFTDLVVRSAPRVAVHGWRFTTSRWLGLPDLLDTYDGRCWPAEGAAPDRAALATVADAAASAMAAAQAALDAARTALATAVHAGDLVELEGLRDAARAAADARAALAATSYDELVAALGVPWRPTPPVVEVLTVTEGDEALALLLDLPEPLPWERVGWTLAAPGGTPEPPEDLVLAWSGDGSRAVLVRAGGVPFDAGEWTLALALRLDVGAERAVWRRAGSSAPEVGALRIDLTRGAA